ncbi:amidohydrolase family protein [Bradyrhizobium huanghuaihaiense]|uniref:amidohydrolase family protein n=1 Tax=Bradyrhizobium huanghuaihaiense TaxID=990078 RepID=UPI0021AAD0B8|nr:amidohydrolase family protein [Bradyrhizobium sp. CB3035]UWU75854.1 amidohydrolase family protein [Bradyrhizobium sp. CB3035]
MENETLDRTAAFSDGESVPDVGCIDCDIHPTVPGIASLLPYMDEHWKRQVVERAIYRSDFTSSSFPPNAPGLCRPDWRPEHGRPGSRPEDLIKHAIAPFGTRAAILNPLSGVQSIADIGMAVAFTKALNDWIAKEWLPYDMRFCASIVVTPEDPGAAAQEIERLASNGRFVQVLMLAGNELPLGRPFYWPIYEAANNHRLPIAIHCGSNYKHAPSFLGWQSYFVAEYVDHPSIFQLQILNIITQGVFKRFPRLRFVCSESGFLWLPAFLWRTLKTWRGLRFETPWVDKSPVEIIRDNFRFTLQPADAPLAPDVFERVFDQLQSDEMILFSTDYPHHHFDGVRALPTGISATLARKICVDNPLTTYPRLKELQR